MDRSKITVAAARLPLRKLNRILLQNHLNWSALGSYQSVIIDALVTTCRLSAAALVLGGLFGLALAYASVSHLRTLRFAAKIYVDLARNTPLLILTFIVYLVFPELGVPALGTEITFIIALSMTAAGGICENLRAAFASMPKTYIEAAKAIGLPSGHRQFYVVLPIALRYALPALTNSVISIFKDSSIASIIAIKELTYVARDMSTNTFRVFEAWLLVAGMYLVLTALLGLLSRFIELKIGRAI